MPTIWLKIYLLALMTPSNIDFVLEFLKYIRIIYGVLAFEKYIGCHK